MQNKVEKLIILVSELAQRTELSDSKLLCLSAIERLKQKDLIAFDILDRLLGCVKVTDDALVHIERVKLMSEELKNELITPLSETEELFLNLAYNKFYDISDEIFSADFWNESATYRLGRITQVFSIYAEILNHKPMKEVLESISKNRPPMEAEISGPLFKFIRNVLAHFSFFDSWDDIWISKQLINWFKSDQSIDKFLEKYKGRDQIKYRYKSNYTSDFTYVSINFPRQYNFSKIYLKDIIKENEGIKFAITMMLRVLNTQVLSISSNDGSVI